MELVKTCTKCKETKALEDFAKASHHKHGRGSWCRICKNAALRAKERANPKYYRELKDKWKIANPGYQKRRYWPGSTSAQAQANFDALMTKQGGVCAICEGPETMRHFKSGEVRQLAIDHCHQTGRVRGLL